jgi:hypothetical protein
MKYEKHEVVTRLPIYSIRFQSNVLMYMYNYDAPNKTEEKSFVNCCITYKCMDVSSSLGLTWLDERINWLVERLINWLAWLGDS